MACSSFFNNSGCWFAASLELPAHFAQPVKAHSDQVPGLHFGATCPGAGRDHRACCHCAVMGRHVLQPSRQQPGRVLQAVGAGKALGGAVVDLQRGCLLAPVMVAQRRKILPVAERQAAVALAVSQQSPTRWLPLLGIALALLLTPLFSALGLPTLTAPVIAAGWLLQAGLRGRDSQAQRANKAGRLPVKR